MSIINILLLGKIAYTFQNGGRFKLFKQPNVVNFLLFFQTNLIKRKLVIVLVP